MSSCHRPNVCLDIAALAIAMGQNLSQAASAAGISKNALKAYRRRYRTYWEKALIEAHKRITAGETFPMIIPDADPGITHAAEREICTATGLLASGLTDREVNREMQLQPNSLDHLRKSYPIYWNKCYKQALNVAGQIHKRLNKRGEVPRNVTAMYRQFAKIDRYGRKLNKPPKIPEINLELGPGLTLTEFFWSYFYPVCLSPRNARPATIAEYRTVLAHWKAYTDDPPVAEITNQLCAKFTRDISARVGDKPDEYISPNTVRKICIHLQCIIDRLGPRNRRNRLGAGLLDDVPYLERPRPRHKPPTDSFTLDEIKQWIDASNLADVPKGLGIAASVWWGALIRFVYNSGLRIHTVMALEWKWLDGNTLTVPGDAYKGGEGHQFFLSKHALEAIEPLRCLKGKHPFIFPWAFTMTSLQRRRRQLQKAAFIPENRRFGFHGLRKAFATESARIAPLITQAGLGHTTMKMTMDHYVHPEVMTNVLDNLPQPK